MHCSKLRGTCRYLASNRGSSKWGRVSHGSQSTLTCLHENWRECINVLNCFKSSTGLSRRPNLRNCTVVKNAKGSRAYTTRAKCMLGTAIVQYFEELYTARHPNETILAAGASISNLLILGPGRWSAYCKHIIPHVSSMLVRSCASQRRVLSLSTPRFVPTPIVCGRHLYQTWK